MASLQISQCIQARFYCNIPLGFDLGVKIQKIRPQSIKKICGILCKIKWRIRYPVIWSDASHIWDKYHYKYLYTYFIILNHIITNNKIDKHLNLRLYGGKRYQILFLRVYMFLIIYSVFITSCYTYKWLYLLVVVTENDKYHNIIRNELVILDLS